MECPLNVRVKLNSPSLWPTMFSVTYTGINFLPLCTAMVCPTISGMTVERRDHVRSTFFSLRAFIPSTFSCRWASTNGPFFVERAIKIALSFRLSALELLAPKLLANSFHSNRVRSGQRPRTNDQPRLFLPATVDDERIRT